MSNEKIKALLTSLHGEMLSIDLDAEIRVLMEDLDTDIHDLLNPDSEQSDSDTVIENAKFLETKFATEHPVAERFIRELVDTLARIGV
jgi:hypothetical protein